MPSIIASGAAFVVCAAGWFLLPSLQTSRRTVDLEASVQLERARRLLETYDAGLNHKALLTDLLAEEEIVADPDEVSDELADEYQQIHTALWEAYSPVDWSGGSNRLAQARYGNLMSQIRDGVDGQADLVDTNDGILDEALTSIDQALSITRGSESSRSHAEANRLKGIILYHQATAERLWALHLRRAGAEHWQKLIGMAMAASDAVAAKGLVAASQIDQEIERVEAKGAQIAATLVQDRQALDAVNAKIVGLEAELSAVESRRDDAQLAERQLQAEGVDFSDPQGGESFGKQLMELDEVYRKADREAKALLFGAYPNARIEIGTDYLTGRYLENDSPNNLTIQHGLLRYRNDRAALAAGVAVQERTSQDLRADLAGLRDMKEALAVTQAEAAQRIERTGPAAAEAFAELNRVDSEAFAIEDSAIQLYNQSSAISRQAAGYADQWIRDAGDQTRTLPSSTQQRSAFQPRTDDRWLGAYISVQQADCDLAKAWIYYERFQTYSRNTVTLNRVLTLIEIPEADVESEQTKAQEAHDLGVEAVANAMDILERTHRDSGKQWTLAAQGASTTYLMVLFGHEDYVTDAIDAYRDAIKSREDSRQAAPFAARLALLENR